MNFELIPTLHPVDFNKLAAIYPPRQVALAARDGILRFDECDRVYVDSAEQFIRQQTEREARL